MTRAELDSAVRVVRPYAERSGDRAFMFVAQPDGMREVRVWPGGRTTVTRVDGNGRPIAEPVRVHWFTRAQRL